MLRLSTPGLLAFDGNAATSIEGRRYPGHRRERPIGQPNIVRACPVPVTAQIGPRDTDAARRPYAEVRRA